MGDKDQISLTWPCRCTRWLAKDWQERYVAAQAHSLGVANRDMELQNRRESRFCIAQHKAWTVNDKRCCERLEPRGFLHGNIFWEEDSGYCGSEDRIPAKGRGAAATREVSAKEHDSCIPPRYCYLSMSRRSRKRCYLCREAAGEEAATVSTHLLLSRRITR